MTKQNIDRWVPPSAALHASPAASSRPAISAEKTVAVSARVLPRVSIIIAGRNAEPWIAEAIESALAQSVPCEVIFSDDCSTDRTLEIAQGFERRGLIVLAASHHEGVCATRNRGAAAAQGEYLCHLDADDSMPPDYIARHLAAMVPGCPLVYGAAKATGEGEHAGTLWRAAPFQSWDRWGYNTINTSSLYARWAFDAAGGWQDAPTMWDYDLALRAMRFGTPRVSEAVLNYRQHPSSWSSALAEKKQGDVGLRELIRRRNARLSVGSIWSGRAPELFSPWFERLALSVRWSALTHRPDCVIVYDRRAADQVPMARTIAARFAEPFASIRFEAIPHAMERHSDELSRRDAVARWMARSTQYLRSTVRGDAMWLVEDDILVPLPACRDLWNLLTSGTIPPEVVSGMYRNRHIPERLVGGWVDPGPVYREPRETPAGREPIEIDYAGCGCLMTWLDRPAIPRTWGSHVDGKIAAHDWSFCLAVKAAGGRVLWHPAVKCGHARSDTDVIWC